jgi:hypothetical protein
MKSIFLTALLILVPLVSPLFALEVAPFYTRNQSPLVQIFGIPAAEEGALSSRGETDLRLALDIANVFTRRRTEEATLHLDGEIYRTTLALRHGVAEGWEVGLDIPYVRHEGGVFDSLIDRFHRTTGLPEGGRSRWQSNDLRYVMTVNGVTGFDLSESTSGVGDVRLTVARQVNGGSPGSRPVALRIGLKLPTGEAARFTGSESTDLSLYLAGTDAVSFGHRNLTWYWGVGGVWLSKGEILTDYQRSFVGFGTLGIGWKPLSWSALKLQFDGHTPFYRNLNMVQLDSSSVQVIFGASFSLPWETLLDIGIAEDLVVGSAPDVVFHFALRRGF